MHVAAWKADKTWSAPSQDDRQLRLLVRTAAARLSVLFPSGDWQCAYTHARFLKHDDGTPLDSVRNLGQVREQQCQLPLGVPWSSPEKNDRRSRLPAQSEERAKVRVGRNDGPFLAGSTVEDLLVASGVHAVLADVHGIVTGTCQALCDDR